MVLLWVLIAIASATQTLNAPGDVQVDKACNTGSLDMGKNSTLYTQTGVLSSLSAEHIETSTWTMNTLKVNYLIANTTEILFSGRVKITGEIRYSESALQISATEQEAPAQQFTTFLGHRLFSDVEEKLNGYGKGVFKSFLEVGPRDWTEIGIFIWQGKTLELKNLPPHSHLRVQTSYHFSGSDSAVLRIDGRVGWMDSQGEENLYTSPINSMLYHTDNSAVIAFDSERIGRVDPLMVYIR